MACSPAGIVKILKSPVEADEQYETVPHPGIPNQLMELASLVHHSVVVFARKSAIGEPKNPVGFVVTLEGARVPSLSETWHEKLDADDGSTTHVKLGPVAKMLPVWEGKEKGNCGVPLCDTNWVSFSKENR